MKKIISLNVLFLILSLSIISVYAVSQDELNEAKNLIDSKISCNNLTNEQLEIIGEYYMEQMMPGISHERAHEMMGIKEGSEAEEQFHINMAKRSYCGENVGTGGMMGGGMMGNYYQNPQNNNNNKDPYQNNFSIFQIFFYIMLTLVITAIILIIILLISKSKNNIKQKGGRVIPY
jgi:cell division protein FtsL